MGAGPWACLRAVDPRDFMASEVLGLLRTSCTCASSRFPGLWVVAAKDAEVRVACSAFNTALRVFLR